MQRKTRSPVRMNAAGLHRRGRDANLRPVPTFQPDPKSPPTPQPQPAEDKDVEAAINRMVEAAYT